MGYRVEEELVIPEYLMHAGVSEEVLRVFGLDPSQEDALLAQIILHGSHEGGRWHVDAVGITTEPADAAVNGLILARGPIRG